MFTLKNHSKKPLYQDSRMSCFHCGKSRSTISLSFLNHRIVSDPRFESNNVAFVWFSFSEDSYRQSKKKLFDYYGGASELALIDLKDKVYVVDTKSGITAKNNDTRYKAETLQQWLKDRKDFYGGI